MEGSVNLPANSTSRVVCSAVDPCTTIEFIRKEEDKYAECVFIYKSHRLVGTDNLKACLFAG